MKVHCKKINKNYGVSFLQFWDFSTNNFRKIIYQFLAFKTLLFDIEMTKFFIYYAKRRSDSKLDFNHNEQQKRLKIPSRNGILNDKNLFVKLILVIN